MNTVFATGDNLDTEGGAFIPKQLDIARETSGVHTEWVKVREHVNHSLSPSISNTGLDNDQNIRAVPMIELIGMGHETSHFRCLDNSKRSSSWMRKREWGTYSGLPRSRESSLPTKGGTDVSMWWSWCDIVLPSRWAWPNSCRTRRMVDCDLRTWLCIGWVHLPTWQCLSCLNPGSGKWLRAEGLRSLR